jgi:hypothetical protein
MDWREYQEQNKESGFWHDVVETIAFCLVVFIMVTCGVLFWY